MPKHNNMKYQYTPNVLDVLNFAGFCRFVEDGHTKVTEKKENDQQNDQPIVTTDLADAPGKDEVDGKPMVAVNSACSENLSIKQSSENPSGMDVSPQKAVDGDGYESDDDDSESEMIIHTEISDTSLEDMMIEYAKPSKVTFMNAKKTDSPEFISDEYAHNLMSGPEEHDPQGKEKGFYLYRDGQPSHIKVLVVHTPNLSETIDLTNTVEKKFPLLKGEIDRLCFPETGGTRVKLRKELADLITEHTLSDFEVVSQHVRAHGKHYWYEFCQFLEQNTILKTCKIIQHIALFSCVSDKINDPNNIENILKLYKQINDIKNSKTDINLIIPVCVEVEGRKHFVTVYINNFVDEANNRKVNAFIIDPKYDDNDNSYLETLDDTLNLVYPGINIEHIHQNKIRDDDNGPWQHTITMALIEELLTKEEGIVDHCALNMEQQKQKYNAFLGDDSAFDTNAEHLVAQPRPSFFQRHKKVFKVAGIVGVGLLAASAVVVITVLTGGAFLGFLGLAFLINTLTLPLWSATLISGVATVIGVSLSLWGVATLCNAICNTIKKFFKPSAQQYRDIRQLPAPPSGSQQTENRVGGPVHVEQDQESHEENPEVSPTGYTM